jgi:hypothetical protein
MERKMHTRILEKGTQEDRSMAEGEPQLRCRSGEYTHTPSISLFLSLTHTHTCQPWQEHFESLPGGVKGRSGADAFQEWAQTVPLSKDEYLDRHKNVKFELPLQWARDVGEDEKDPKGRGR